MDSRVLPAHVRAQAARRARLTLGGLLCAAPAHNIFGPERIAHFQAQHAELPRDIDATRSDRTERLRRKLDEIDHKIAL